MPSIYFAHRREVFRRDGMLYAVSPFVELLRDEQPFEESVRFRTVGDMSCTGAVRSDAATLGLGRRGDRRCARDRARRDTRRRSHLRSGHGGPQEGGGTLAPSLLMGLAAKPANRISSPTISY